MTKIAAWLLTAISMLMAGAAFASPCAGFTDVDDTAVSAELCQSVGWVKNRGITTGCTSSTFYCPNNPVLRSQMALFMTRMGDKLTPVRYFVDQNPGSVTIQNGQFGFVCPSASHTPQYEQHAVIHGNAWGLVNAPVTWSADVWYSTDGGATFAFATDFIPTFNATVTGMTSGSAFAQLPLTSGTSYIFALLIRESIDVTTGAGNFTDLACHLMVEIGNRTPTAAPPPTCDAIGPHLGCGDPAGAMARKGEGRLPGNRSYSQ
jgi:hypothetical protein